MATITRAAFIQATEAGIAAARDLSTVEKLALRMNALVATEVTRTVFDSCPLTEAGLASRVPAFPWQDDGPYWRFINAFDRVAERAFIGTDYAVDDNPFHAQVIE